MKKLLFTLTALALIVGGTLSLNHGKASAAGGTTYPGCDASIPLVDAWPMRDKPGSTVAVDTIRPVNSLQILKGWGTAPYVTFNGSSAHASDQGMLMKGTNINPMDGDWVFAATIQTSDGLYNFAQFGTSPGHAGDPSGFIKLTAAYMRVNGTLGLVKIDSNRNYSDGIKHYLCMQRVGNTFSYYIDGVLQGTPVTQDIGSINFTAAKQPLMFLGKYQPGIGFKTSDMLNGYGWNLQFAWRAHQ